MHRIAIVGPGGAGKSTLARQLGERLGLPVIHLDAEHWRAGWVEPSVEEWQARVRALVARPRWVMDGNYGGTMELRFAAADTIVFLDFPRLLCIWRVGRRLLRYRGRSRPDMAPGCPEQISFAFVRWIWEYPRTRRPGVLARMARAGAGARHVILRSPREVRIFLRSLPPAAPP